MAINGIVGATLSLLGVVIDGTGGNVVTPVPGALVLSGTASGVAAPTPAVPWGTIYREGVLFGGAYLDAGGAFQSGYNVKSVAKPGPGHYEVTFNGKPTNLARCRGQATGMFNAAAFIPELNSFAVVGADLKATVFMYDAAGNLADAGFNLDVVGG